jgi:dihydroorotase
MTTKTPIGRAHLISNAQLVDPSTKLDRKGDVLVDKGVIIAVSKPGELKSKAKSLKAKEIDAKGMILTPGFIDLQTLVHEPGEEYVEDFSTASMAAAAGGFTTITSFPCSNPVHDNAFMTDFIKRRAMEKSCVRVELIGAVTAGREGKRLAEIGSMLAAGARAVGDVAPIMDSYLMRKALEYCKTFSVPIISIAEDRGLVGHGVMNEGFSSNRLGLRGIPPAAEEIMVWRDIVLARHTGGRIHFSSLTTKGSMEAVRRAKEEGLAITADTSPHYFSLTSDAISSYDSNYKCFPPLRSEEDCEALIEALADGTLDSVSTQHLPQPLSLKDMAFELAAPGMIGLETALPLCLQLVKSKRLKLSRMVEILANNPAKALGLSGQRGSLREGAVADLVLLDLNSTYSYDDRRAKSAARNSPFLGRKFHGAAVMTMVNGTIVHE